MDDWGSPWADEIQIQHSDNKLVERPVTPVETSDLDFEGQGHISSPWDDGDDDSVGEWGSAPATERRTGFDGAGDGWTIDTMKDVATNCAASIQQGNDRNISSSLPSLHAELVRKTSDDPWVDEVATINCSSPFTDSKYTENQVLQSPIDNLPKSPASRSIILDDVKTTSKIGDILQEPAHISRRSSESLQSPRSEQLPAVEHLLSRPCSSPSEHSQHDEIPQESPRTSIDDEPKKLQISRKESRIVVELLEDPAERKNNQLSDDRTFSYQEMNADVERHGEEEPEDFGDFEEGQSDLEESPHSDSTKHIRTQSPLKEHEIIQFKVESSTVNKIYSNLPLDTPKKELFIPDTVPYDSFSSTEERKLWYRVSRYGPMRKYDNGDDERYARVNWVHSKIREETLKIVGRWMEEDRVSGRIILGGSHKSSSIFGWNDHKSSHTPLSQVFLERRPRKHTEEPIAGVEVSRELPKRLVANGLVPNSGLFLNAPQESSLKSILIAKEPTISAETPTANFGWNSGFEGSQNSTAKPSGGSLLLPSVKILAASEQSTLPSPININGGTTRIVKPAQSPPTVLPISTNHEVNRARAILNPSAFSDDDWGEMVSSPVKDPPLNISSTHGLLHKKSQSLGGAFTLPLQSSPSRSTLLQSSRNSMSATRPVESPSTQYGLQKGSNETIITGIAAGNFGNPFATQVKNAREITRTSVDFSNLDPWASADFSFFEKAITPESDLAILPESLKSATLGKVQPQVQSQQHRKSKEEIEQDVIVQNVVKTLPDLSYMLRK